MENTSRPWSSVPSQNTSPVKALGSIGGEKPFIRSSDDGSNGFVVATSGANTAASTRRSVTRAAAIATGERRNE